jgi:hypothetical protein
VVDDDPALHLVDAVPPPRTGIAVTGGETISGIGIGTGVIEIGRETGTGIERGLHLLLLLLRVILMLCSRRIK